MLLVSGKPDSVFTTQCDTFQQPRHVTGKHTHRLQPFRIPANLLRVFPCTTFQYCDGTMGILQSAMYLFIWSSAAVAPLRRQVAIAAAGLPAKWSPLNSSMKNTRSKNEVIAPLAAA